MTAEPINIAKAVGFSVFEFQDTIGRGDVSMCDEVMMASSYCRTEEVRFSTSPLVPVRRRSIADYVDNDDRGELLLGIVLLVYAWQKLRLPLSFSTIGWVFLIVACGFLLYFSIHLFFNTFAFWIVRNEPRERMAWELDRFTSYPMTVYGPIVRFVLTWLIPFGFVSFYPSTILLGKEPAASGRLTALVAVGALLAAYRFWLFGLAKYQSTGS